MRAGNEGQGLLWLHSKPGWGGMPGWDPEEVEEEEEWRAGGGWPQLMHELAHVYMCVFCVVACVCS